MTKSNQYNPFYYLNNEIDIKKFSDFIVDISVTHTEENIEYQKIILEMICLYLVKYCPDQQHNFTSIIKLLRAAEIDKDIPAAKTNLIEFLTQLLQEILIPLY